MAVHRAGLALAVGALAAALPAPASGRAAISQAREAAGSLPAVTSGHRPGPDVLYAPAPRAPQLENRHPAFRAGPILVAGSERYVDGEYLYQDYLNDDHGADVDGGGDGAQSAAVGDLVYPTDTARHGNNGADLVELRLAAQGDAVIVRFTLNTLRAADAAIMSLVLDLDANPATGLTTLPRDPGAGFPGTDLVLTTWGTGAELTRRDGTATSTVSVPVVADLEAAQLTVTLPSGALVLAGVARYVVIVGVHDRAGGWARPGDAATATMPGGSDGKLVSAIFNLGPRPAEPVRERGTPSDEAQAFSLGAGTPASFAHEIDLGAIASRQNRDLAPKTGTMLRIFPSRLELGGGRASTFPHFRQQLTEYSVRVPLAAGSDRALGLTLYLHALNEYHWTNNSNPYLRWVGDDRDSLVATPLNRGPDGFYIGPAEFDTFEVWNDLARHFWIDPAYVSIMGTSMGGYGTYRLAGLYPDLFARAVTNVGPPGANIWAPPLPPDHGLATLSNLWLDNTRNVPFLNQVATTDELVPFTGSRAQNLGAPELGIRGFDQLGHRFRFRIYHPADHIVLSISSDPVVPAFLGRQRVDRDPRRVTFRYVPAADDRALGLIHDHAYWISGVSLRADAPPAPAGPVAETPDVRSAYVDATSHAMGRGEPVSTGTADVGLAETVPVRITYQEIGRTWSAEPATPASNKLDVRLTGVAGVTIDAARAGLDASRRIVIALTADGPGVVRLSSVDSGSVVSGALKSPDPNMLSFTVSAGSQEVVIEPPTTVAGRAAVQGLSGGAGRLPATGGHGSQASMAGLALALVLAGRSRLRRTSGGRDGLLVGRPRGHDRMAR